MRNQDGSALVTVLIIGIIGIIINSIMFKSISISIRRTSDRRIDITLFNIAEAGNEHALATLKSGQISPIANSKIQVVENADFRRSMHCLLLNYVYDGYTMLFSDATYRNKSKSILTAYAVSWASFADEAYNKAIAAG